MLLYKHLFGCLFALLLATAPLRAQQTAPPPPRTIASADWERAKKGIVYPSVKAVKPNKPKEAVKEKKVEGYLTRFFNWLSAMSAVVRVLFFLVLVGLVGVVVYLLAGRSFFAGNARVRRTDFSEAALETLDERILETDLDRWLRQALEAGNYSAAVRIYYLAIIKALTLNEVIVWKKDKTNADYLRELRNHAFYLEFARSTRIFERVRYSNLEETARLDRETFSTLQPLFVAWLATANSATKSSVVQS